MRAFFHVYPVADYEAIVREIDDLLLQVPCEVTRIVGEDEIATLSELWHEATYGDPPHSDDTNAVLYIHTKGVTKKGEMRACVDEWRHLMEYFVIERWNECVAKLGNGYDTAGVNWKAIPMRHYSGNFWWANRTYTRSLIRPILWQERLRNHPSAPEFWICSNPDVRAYSFMDSGVNHYHERYPRERYAHAQAL